MVPVAGVEAVGAPLDAAHVHRVAEIAALTDLPAGTRLTPDAVATVLLDPRGNVKGAPPHARIVPLVNKVTTPAAREAARAVAAALLARGAERVVSLHDYVSDADGDGDARRAETMTSPHPDPERLTGYGELRRLLEDAIDALPDDFRAVFVLRAVEGMSVAETAAALAIPPETVKTRLHRARQRLQEALGARFEALMPAAFDFAGARCDRIVAAVLARIGPALEEARQQPHSD